jgi:hypothetical protein
MRGGSKREDPSFWVLRLDETNSPTPHNGCRFISRFTKCRNTSKQPKTYEWTYSPAGNGEILVEVKEASPLLIFRDHIANGLDTCSTLANEMGVSDGYISQLSTLAEKEGWIKKEKRKYVLID